MSYRREEKIKLYIFLAVGAFILISFVISPTPTTTTNIPAETLPNKSGSYISINTPAGETTPKQFTRATSTGNVTTFL